MRYKCLSLLKFACVWLAVSFLMSTTGDLRVGDKDALALLETTRNLYFAALACPFSAAFFALAVGFV